MIHSTLVDPSQIERVSEMLDDIWKRGIDITEISSQAGTQLPTIEVTSSETVAKTVSKLLQNKVTSVLITERNNPLGVINDRELLREIVDSHKDPVKTIVKDINYTPLIILEEDQSMVTAMELIGERGFKRAAIVKNGQLIGMLTEGATKKAGLQVKPVTAKSTHL